jgi:fumarylpyruvate hydrolase
MSTLVFPGRPRPIVPIIGGNAAFPVGRILCVGRNYAAHRREMGGDDRDPPFFFAKPGDAVVTGGASAPYPSATNDLQHEIELVVAIGGAGEAVEPSSALDLVFGYAVGVDLTRRDLQAAAKAKGHPWDAAKGFDHSAPISDIRPWSGAPPSGPIRLTVNGAKRQDARLEDMIWSIAEVIAEASRLWRLEPGDLIYTGTPEGVGPLARGDKVVGEIDGVGRLSFAIGA